MTSDVSCGVGVVLLLALAMGCRSSSGSLPVTSTTCEDPQPQAEPAAARAGIAPVGLVRRELASSVEGRPIEVVEIGPSGGETVLILASIHGNESAGTPLVERLARELERDPALAGGRRVVLVPVANPDGVAYRRRHNRRGVDLNRNFSADNFQAGRQRGASPSSEPESRALQDLISSERPARVVSIHQPLGCIDWDGPAEALAERLAAEGTLPIRKLGSRPGSLGSWVGLSLCVPIITLELPRSADRLDEEASWKTYGPLLLAAIEGPRRAAVEGLIGPMPNR